MRSSFGSEEVWRDDIVGMTKMTMLLQDQGLRHRCLLLGAGQRSSSYEES